MPRKFVVTPFGIMSVPFYENICRFQLKNIAHSQLFVGRVQTKSANLVHETLVSSGVWKGIWPYVGV